MIYIYRVRQIQIRKGHKLYGYCCSITDKVSKLYNRANYIVRQYATGIEAEAAEKEKKLPTEINANHAIINAIINTKYE